MRRETGLWQDVSELPESLAATITARDGVEDVAALLGSEGVRRIVATGNGAAYYVAVALWLASLEGGAGPEVVAVPSGLVARGAFGWRPGDALLAVSSSGEFRDLVEAIDTGAPLPYAAITATPGSTLGSRAGARALVAVSHQRAVTHTQAFCGGVATAHAVWGEVTDDAGLRDAIAAVPRSTAVAVEAARGWVHDAAGLDAPVAVAFRRPERKDIGDSGPVYQRSRVVPARHRQRREGRGGRLVPGRASGTAPARRRGRGRRHPGT